MEDRRGDGARDRTAGVWEGKQEHPVLAAARAYTRRGWRVVPLKADSKKATIERWPDLRLEEDDLARYFPPGQRGNLGVLDGAPSGGLADVDCDWPEAIRAAALLLPPTGLVHGRASKPASHYWYAVAACGETRSVPNLKWQVAEGDAQGSKQSSVIAELRGDRLQTMAPPSIHPEGERLRWEREGEPGRVSLAALRQALAQVAACALLARCWPGLGSRNEAALALTGLLLRGGWSAEDADHFVAAVAQVAGDEESPARGTNGRLTAAKLAAGQPVTGGTKLATLLRGDGATVVEQVREWLQLRDGGSHRRSALAQADHVHGMIAYGGNDRLRDVQGHVQEGDVQVAADGEEVEWAPKGALLEAVLLSEVREEPVRWLWPGRIPLGALTVLDGDPGLGKSLVTLDLVARITTGRPMPDGTPGVEGGVLLLCAEDSAAHTILPRVRAAGGRPERVKIVGSIKELDPTTGAVQERPFRLPGDTHLLERHAREVDARLIVIDPLTAFVDPRLNSFRDQDMREALGPSVRLTAELGVAALCVRHMTKGDGTNPLYRGGGSIAIIGVARSGLIIAKDPDDPENSRVLASSKSNLGPPAPSLRYRILQGSQAHEGESREAVEAPSIEWLGTCDYTAMQLLSAVASAIGPASASALDTACAFLRAALASGPRLANEVLDAARAARISEATLNRARKQLNVQTRRDGFGGPWVWALPPSGEPAFSAGSPRLPIWKSAPAEGPRSQAAPESRSLLNVPDESGGPDPSQAIIPP
jgi:hypothetical protein